ncbi:low molecular weight protein-tyrosine-phosphatase [Thalassotalea agarivorans]|uniref:protein-tyrosine-phosphatase n=1 Tax=Thalassotalea agarivorans TaxID=349064 RepID=A0A1H9Y3T8_THASX|nr:low molecular weight protein-tyrosine-phosphatase [Thalassotalea agarivorans]SES63002.1 protein tyrosine phosphatase [Thalassotalea agarivorans]
MFNNILIVCVGNICRSPSAEVILKELLPNKDISSAGIHAVVGADIESNAANQLNIHGHPYNTHQATQLTEELAARAELILVMEKKHQQILMQKYPSASGKIMLLGKWNCDEDIPDPYKKDTVAFEHAYNQINKHCALWADKIK